MLLLVYSGLQTKCTVIKMSNARQLSETPFRTINMYTSMHTAVALWPFYSMQFIIIAL